MLQCPVNLTIPTLNKTSDTNVSKDNGCEPWWGPLTIAMSWIPPTIIFLLFSVGSIRGVVKKGNISCRDIINLFYRPFSMVLGPVVYALWALLVPIGM